MFRLKSLQKKVMLTIREQYCMITAVVFIQCITHIASAKLYLHRKASLPIISFLCDSIVTKHVIYCTCKQEIYKKSKKIF